MRQYGAINGEFTQENGVWIVRSRMFIVIAIVYDRGVCINEKNFFSSFASCDIKNMTTEDHCMDAVHQDVQLFMKYFFPRY